MSKAMIWQRMAVKLGGPEHAMEAHRNKDIFCVTNPRDNNKRLYIMQEHVNEECWTSANILQGMQRFEAPVGSERRLHARTHGRGQGHPS